MENEQSQQQDNQGGAGDGGQQQGTSFDALLNWDPESGADAPKLEVNAADFKEFWQQKQGELVESVTADLSEKARREQAQREAQVEASANAKADMDFAADLDRRSRSANQAERDGALAEIEANRERYRRGLAIGWQMESQERSERVLSDHLTPMWQDLRTKGHTALIDEKFKDATWMSQFGGNWIAAVLEYGRELGFAAGKGEAAAENDRTERLNAATNGAPPDFGGTQPGSVSMEKLLEGVDRTKPGAAAEVQRRIAAARSKR